MSSLLVTRAESDIHDRNNQPAETVGVNVWPPWRHQIPVWLAQVPSYIGYHFGVTKVARGCDDRLPAALSCPVAGCDPKGI